MLANADIMQQSTSLTINSHSLAPVYRIAALFFPLLSLQTSSVRFSIQTSIHHPSSSIFRALLFSVMQLRFGSIITACHLLQVFLSYLKLKSFEEVWSIEEKALWRFSFFLSMSTHRQPEKFT